MGATLLDRTTGPLNEADIAAAGDTRYSLDTRLLNINGGVEVSQELGLTGATLVNNTAKYAADMWEGMYNHTAATAVVTAGQIAAASFPAVRVGFPNAFQIKATTAITAPANGDFALARTKIEGYRAARLGWGAANPSSLAYGFWFYATASGTISVRVGNAAANRFYWHEHAVTGGIWNWCSYALAGDATGTWAKDNTVGIEFAIFASGKAAAPAAPDAWSATGGTASTNTTNLLGTANNVCLITGLVLVPGTAIPNSLRLYGNMRTFDEELLLCQRYLCSDFPYGTTPADNVQAMKATATAGSNTASLNSGKYFYPVRMRAVPTITFYASNAKATPAAGQWQYFLTSYTDGSATAVFTGFVDGFSMSMTTGAVTLQSSYIITGSWKADARL
jgi:hypothetical protein